MSKCTAYLFVGALLCIIGNIAAVKFYHIELHRVITEIKDANASEYLELYLKLVKTGRNTRCMNGNFTLKKGFNNDMECQIRVYQKIGGKFLKAPIHFPKKPCCHFYDENPQLWECVTKKTSVPNVCPIPPGNYGLFNKDPNDCEMPLYIPPNVPEDILTELSGYVGNKELVCIKMFIKLRKLGFLG